MKTLIQFFSLARSFWRHKQAWLAWLWLCAVVGFSLAIISVSVWITEWNKTFYDALAAFNGEDMPKLILTYLSYMELLVTFIACGNWLKKALIFRWRTALTAKFQTSWLKSHNHYRLVFGQNPDNPDQRIADDISQLTEKSIDLFKYFIMNVAKLIVFVSILWKLSGVQYWQIAGINLEIHGYLVWVALLYSLVCTLVMHLIGHQLQKLNITRQHTEADYRAALLRIRENSEQIAFYHGEKEENQRLNTHFRAIRNNWLALIHRELKVEIFSASYLRLSLFIPIFATLPMYLARTLTFGDMMQARSAFSNVQDGFGWFMDYYKRLMEWSAVVKRLAEFQTAILEAEKNLPPAILTTTPAKVQVENLSVKTPAGKVLFANFSLNLTACDWVLLEGKSGAGKSTLLRTLAGLWPYYQGKRHLQAPSYLFLPQKPYLFEASLAELLKYPYATHVNEAQLITLLTQVGLANLTKQLHETQPWHKQLSGGEQQRISLARAMLHQPALLFLDEATNQLDDEAATMLMQQLKLALPNTLCIAVSHQIPVKNLFQRQITLQ